MKEILIGPISRDQFSFKFLHSMRNGLKRTEFNYDFLSFHSFSLKDLFFSKDRKEGTKIILKNLKKSLFRIKNYNESIFVGNFDAEKVIHLNSVSLLQFLLKSYILNEDFQSQRKLWTPPPLLETSRKRAWKSSFFASSQSILRNFENLFTFLHSSSSKYEKEQ